MKGRRKRKLLSRAFGAGFLGVGILVSGMIAWKSITSSGPSAEEPLLASATKSTLNITVVERGELQSQQTVDGVCELDGHQNKIIKLVPEGTLVKKGDIVCQFDSAEIDKSIAEQDIKVKQARSKSDTAKSDLEVARNKAESDVNEAEVELVLAKLDLEKFIKGDYLVEVKDLEGNIALARKDMEEVGDRLAQYRTLVKRGYKSPEQLKAVEQEFEQKKYFLDRDVHKLAVKRDYEFARKKTEAEFKVTQADRKLNRNKANKESTMAKSASEYEAAVATLKIEGSQFERFTKQKDRCRIIAGQDGIVLYANEAWYDSSRQVREGATVYSRQKIFSLPDMTKMEVKVAVHESLIKKVKVGQKAEIRVDALANVLLWGTVKKVSHLADSERSWLRGGAKEYPCIITIDRMPAEELKPGMTAEVKILVKDIADALLVPVQAVTQNKGEHFVFVKEAGQFNARKVDVGETNDKHVEIKGGLTSGEMVALDARKRGELFFKSKEDLIKTPEKKEDKKTNGNGLFSKI